MDHCPQSVTPTRVSDELVHALADAGLIELCRRCVTSKGLCAPCLAREGPRFAQPSMWLRLMGQRDGDGCPKCGAECTTDLRDDGSMWIRCTGFPELCHYEHRIETLQERHAREAYEVKAERRAMALARCTAAARGRFVKNRIRIPVQRVA